MQREHPTKHYILHAKLTWNKNIILHTRESELYILTRLISLKDDFMSLFILMFSNETIHAILQNWLKKKRIFLNVNIQQVNKFINKIK